ncbi:hypothetical protein HPB48_013236 [Haemaphysalis longicornis]|uniref:Nucleic-acid-binding protein from mobile element jockey n=1 Tax=Haemaphysalis longicornis TaxID=44386 RepID=A0A9J6GC23_HAELO|nr:hypothetical protein HPB48_013236 [Haemaphysalis longicornis]
MPEHSIIGYTWYLVFEYNETPIQCTKCQAFSHVAVTCTFSLRCARCADNHNRSACGVKNSRCANCTKQHDLTPLNCPVRRKENAITDVRSTKKTNYKSAKVTSQKHCGTTTKDTPKRNIKTPDGYTSVNVDKYFSPLPLREWRQSVKLHTKSTPPQPPLEAACIAAPPDLPVHISPVVPSVASPAAALTSPKAKQTAFPTSRETRNTGLAKSPHRACVRGRQPETSSQQSMGKLSSLILSITQTMRTLLASFSSPEAEALITLIGSAARFLTQWL